MYNLYIKSYAHSVHKKPRCEVRGTRAAGDSDRQKMIFLDDGDDGSVVRQERQIHHDRGDSRTVAAVAVARDEDGETYETCVLSFEPGDGHPGLRHGRGRGNGPLHRG